MFPPRAATEPHHVDPEAAAEAVDEVEDAPADSAQLQEPAEAAAGEAVVSPGRQAAGAAAAGEAAGEVAAAAAAEAEARGGAAPEAAGLHAPEGAGQVPGEKKR